ncbi:hypothetical protein LCGC14_0434310 [marine sediment metagenome]|uniref:Uncharacterized protein n=1 Tax=marine sediment metagenome TaxID=412755 RepID=A0A0F9V955_9ZZZZ|nr:hypothetical protein [Pricia sp.]
MAKKTEVKEGKVIVIPAIEKKIARVRIIGETPIIMHRFSEKIQKEILKGMTGSAKKKKPPKDPEQEYRDSMYWLDKEGFMMLPNGDPLKHKTGFGMPSRAFKKAMVSACRSIDGVDMTLARNAFFIMSEFTPLLNHNFKTFAKPRRRTEPLRLPNRNTMDIRSRGEFLSWAAILVIEYNANIISLEQIVNLVNVAGFGVGVGEDRPDKTGGIQGRFEVAGISKVA